MTVFTKFNHCMNLSNLPQVEVFWVVTLHSVVVGYRHFVGPHSIFRVKIETARTSETMVSYYNTMQCHSLKHLDLKYHCHERLTTFNL